MGTGTSFVKVEGGENISHIGGIGIGGGTIQGLSCLLLKTQNIHQVVKMAEKGVIENIDLQIKDICKSYFHNFSNYGRLIVRRYYFALADRTFS